MSCFHPLSLMILLLAVSLSVSGLAKYKFSVTAAQKALDDYNEKASIVLNNMQNAYWNYSNNQTRHNQNKSAIANIKYSTFKLEAARNLSHFKNVNMTDIMKREFKKILDIGVAAQTDLTKVERLQVLLQDMQNLYVKAKACISPTECYNSTTDFELAMTKSRDPHQLLNIWKAWRLASGNPIKDLYTEFVSLSNEAVRISGYKDTGDYWRSSYDMDDFQGATLALFDEVLPLYEQLHAYARRKLKEFYGNKHFPSTGQIPAHLLGDMWAQGWSNIKDILIPFKNHTSLDVTEEMVRQGYTPVTMFQMADEFFESLGLMKASNLFWDKSILERPNDTRVMDCHPVAWDFVDSKDFRIRQCAKVNQADLEIAHHEMGHIQYYQQYKDQPVSFRDGANPGFHEAVGDMIMLSVSTPKHMQGVKLVKGFKKDNETDINVLMHLALSRIAFIPYGYLLDQWRWSVFKGDTKPDQYNDHWWKLRCKLQGVSPPVKRSSSGFDPGAKYHVPANMPYIRYFISFIIQFQFHQAACEKAGHKGPLHDCDIYNSKEAGTAIGDMLKLGSSVPWQDALEKLTGQRKMSAKPLMDFFKPLMQFLKKENGDDFGWKAECPSFD